LADAFIICGVAGFIQSILSKTVMKLRKMFLVSEDYYNNNCKAPVREKAKPPKAKAIVKKKQRSQKEKLQLKNGSKFFKIVKKRNTGMR
jgi:predicted HicB family RNase H-like nuclease